MVGETVVMNATSMGLANLSTQTGTVETIGGAGLLMTMLAIGLAFYLAHEFNLKGSWLNKLMEWLNKVGAFKAVIGGWTTGVLYGGYLISGWFGSSDGQGSIIWVLQGAGYLILGFAALVAIGYLAEPVWRAIWHYVTATKAKKGASL